MQGSLGLAAAFLFLALCLCAEFGSGIQGTIVDNSGAVIPSACLVVTNVSAGVSRDVLTSGAGIFRVLSLGAGTYTVSATKDGGVRRGIQ